MMEKDCKRIILGRMGRGHGDRSVFRNGDTVVKPNGLSYLPTFLILSKILSKNYAKLRHYAISGLQ